MSNYYSIVAPAKLNLNLFVNGVTDNGLHLLESDICFLELSDKIYFEFSEEDTFFQINTNKSFIINSEDNLILRSLDAFRNKTNWGKKFKINLFKNIPIGAGLGGGSADAAATLILLRKLFNIENKFQKISISNLYEIGDGLGSDIPACLESKGLRLKGHGDKITRNKIPDNYYYLLVNPNIKLSTKDVFTQFKNFSNKTSINNNIFFNNINIHNSLLSSAIHLAPPISSILSTLKKIPKIVAYGMSGSGSTCFGIFHDLKNILPFLNIFQNKYFVWYGKKKDYSLNRVSCSKVLENKF